MSNYTHYKGMSFPKDFDMSFEDFKAAFGENHVFGSILPTEREAALKEAHEIATAGKYKAETKSQKTK